VKIDGLLLASLLLLAPAAPVAQSSSAPQVATVRGLLEHNPDKAKKAAPAVKIAVAVVNDSGHSFGATSGQDGMYYIANVPPGDYALKVWVDPKNPLTFTITVKAPLTDVPPVIVDPPPVPAAHPGSM
jgi:hypothetical protein